MILAQIYICSHFVDFTSNAVYFHNLHLHLLLSTTKQITIIGVLLNFPFTAQKGDAVVWCLAETSSTQLNPNQSHPGCHLEAESAASGRLGKASCAAGSWLRDGLEEGNVGSDSAKKKGRSKQKPI